MRSDIVRLRDVHFSYDGSPFDLSIGDLSIARGERVACVGPSGCGKTTLIGLMTGILVPGRGHVALGDEPLAEQSDAERRAIRIRRVGLVFQEFALLDYLTGLENILLAYHVSPALTLDDAALARARALASALGIEHMLRRRPGRLSQGERQRVAIARSLVTEPELVVCDEPTGNLDPAMTDTTLSLLFEQVTARNATLLVVTHDHALLDRFDRVIDMESLS